MCGRVGFFSDGLFINDVQAVLGDFVNDIGNLTPHYNIAPSKDLPALLSNHHYTETSFGLIPHWARITPELHPRITPQNYTPGITPQGLNLHF